MTRPIEEDCIDAALLDVRVEDAFGRVLKSQADGVLHEIGGDLLQGSVGVFFVKHMDAVNGSNAREHKEGIIICEWKEIHLEQ